MPRVSKWMADAMEKVFRNQFHPMTVTEVTYPSQALKRIQFRGDLAGVSYTPGNVIEFRISDEEFRHYTPLHLDAQAGVCEVLFYLHDLGPGSRWAADLRAGDTLNLMGPGRKMNFRPDVSQHLLFGDESSLGLALGFARAAAGDGSSCQFLLELDQTHERWPEALGLRAATVPKSATTPGQGAEQWLNALDDEQWNRLRSGTFYLTGQAASIQRLNRTLRGRRVPRQRIQITPYWAEGKTGL